MSEPLPAGATLPGLTHASRLMWEVMLELRRYTIAYKDRAMQDTQHKALEAVNILTRMGAECPIGDPLPGFFPQLQTDLDTPEARQLLDALKHTLALAEVVDAQRGNVMTSYTPMSDTDSQGTDYAESVSNIAARLSMEIQPPRGRGE